MSFKIGSLKSLKHVKKTQYISVQTSLAFLTGDNVQSQILKRDQKKMSAWWDLKSSFHRYLSVWAYCV